VGATDLFLTEKVGNCICFNLKLVNWDLVTIGLCEGVRALLLWMRDYSMVPAVVGGAQNSFGDWLPALAKGLRIYLNLLLRA
jgi:hypothetical protein